MPGHTQTRDDIINKGVKELHHKIDAMVSEPASLGSGTTGDQIGSKGKIIGEALLGEGAKYNVNQELEFHGFKELSLEETGKFGSPTLASHIETLGNVVGAIDGAFEAVANFFSDLFGGSNHA